MIKFMMMNLHIAPFMVMFFIGMAITVTTSLSFRYRTKTFVTHPGDKYLIKKNEKKLKTLGILLIAAGVIGSGIITEIFGHYYTYTDIDGKVNVINSKDRDTEKKDYEL